MRIAAAVFVAATIALGGLLATGWAEWTWQVLDIHMALVAVANVISASVALLALSAFLRSGYLRDLGVAIAFSGFVAFYVWHGVFTGAPVPFKWLIYGPAARIAFGLGLIVMIIPLGVIRQRSAWGLGVFGGVLLLGLGLGFGAAPLAAWAAGRTDLNTWRLFLEGAALSLVVGAWLGLRRAPWINAVFEAGIAIVAAQSIYFFFAAPWDLIWWGAHAFGAGGTVLLASGVLLVARHHEQEEAQQQQAAEARLRQQFINEANHALGTPLTTLAINLHMMASEQGDSPRIEAMQRAVHRLEILSRQMLTLADEGGVDCQDVVVRDVVNAAVDAHRRQWPGHEIRMDLDDGMAWADAARLQMVVAHLLDNARVYAPGPVDVAVRHTRDAMEIRVADQGPGIPKEQRGRVFLPFARYGEGQSAGFTLAWSRRTMEAMGGTLDVEGERGATFVVRLAGDRTRRGSADTSTQPRQKAIP